MYNKEINTIEQIIKELEICLKNNMYISALCLALTLPDICGKVEFPEIKKPSDRYKEYCKKHIETGEDKENIDMPYLSAEVIYNLRCSLFHAGDIDVNTRFNGSALDDFTLYLQSENDSGFYPEFSSISYKNDKKIIDLNVNVRNLCLIILLTAKSFVKRCKQNKINLPIIRALDIDKFNKELEEDKFNLFK